MHFSSLTVLLTSGNLVLAACVSRPCRFDSIKASSDLRWCLCEDEEQIGFQCARLEVPLDYGNPELGKASIPLIKYSATQNSSHGPYQGMMLINPGGPGDSGIQMALGGARLLQEAVGPNWDIIGFEPRGIYNSLPSANCSQQTTLDRRSASTTPHIPNSYLDLFTSRAHDLSQTCQSKISSPKSAGPHMSTAIVARDMLSIVNAFAETPDGKRAGRPHDLLNFYGESYGTFLGQTFASMFPSHVGRMVLDGVVDPADFVTNYVTNSVLHLDGVIASYFIYCHAAGAPRCQFAQGSTSAKDVYDRFNRSFTQLNAAQAQGEGWANATAIADALSVLKWTLFTGIYVPSSSFKTWSHLFTSLEEALAQGDIQSWTKSISEEQEISPKLDSVDGLEYNLGVLCSDQGNRWYGKTQQDVQPLIDMLQGQSILGELWARALLGCLGWGIKAAEVYQGPWGGETKEGILFVSNTYDPVTPIENAIAYAPKYKNSIRLTVDGIGHTSRRSECFLKKFGEYFRTGKLAFGTFCALEQGPFGLQLNGTLEENLANAGLTKLQ